MTEEERERFLGEPRYGVLSTLSEDGLPVSVPVWFEWDGNVVHMHSSKKAPKVRRLKADPRASLLVVNRLDELEAWVAFDGEIAISNEGGFVLAERLAHRYWNLNDPARAKELEAWRQNAAGICLLTLTPSRIRTM